MQKTHDHGVVYQMGVFDPVGEPNTVHYPLGLVTTPKTHSGCPLVTGKEGFSQGGDVTCKTGTDGALTLVSWRHADFAQRYF